MTGFGLILVSNCLNLCWSPLKLILSEAPKLDLALYSYNQVTKWAEKKLDKWADVVVTMENLEEVLAKNKVNKAKRVAFQYHKEGNNAFFVCPLVSTSNFVQYCGLAHGLHDCTLFLHDCA